MKRDNLPLHKNLQAWICLDSSTHFIWIYRWRWRSAPQNVAFLIKSCSFPSECTRIKMLSGRSWSISFNCYGTLGFWRSRSTLSTIWFVSSITKSLGLPLKLHSLIISRFLSFYVRNSGGYGHLQLLMPIYFFQVACGNTSSLSL